jgi:NAD(P)H-nitrite reductase large subunit
LFLQFDKESAYLPTELYNRKTVFLPLITKKESKNMNLNKICFCNEVLEIQIVNAITKKGALTLAEVQKLTRAGIDCGRCKPKIKSILERELAKLPPNAQLSLDIP